MAHEIFFKLTSLGTGIVLAPCSVLTAILTGTPWRLLLANDDSGQLRVH
jgi:hypothetical protein